MLIHICNYYDLRFVPEINTRLRKRERWHSAFMATLCNSIWRESSKVEIEYALADIYLYYCEGIHSIMMMYSMTFESSKAARRVGDTSWKNEMHHGAALGFVIAYFRSLYY